MYGIPAQQSNVDQLKFAFKKDEDAMELQDTDFGVCVIASVLKIYLRGELKQPLYNSIMQDRIGYSRK